MRTIKIGFSAPQNVKFPIYSWIIRAVYNTPYSHTYMRFYSNSIERDIIYESVGVGVRFVGNEMWSKHARVIEEFELQVTDEQYTKIMQFCVDKAGTKYGIMQAFGICVAKLFRIKKNIFANGEKLDICSEEIARLMTQLGYSFKTDFDLIVPKDIYNVLKNKPT